MNDNDHSTDDGLRAPRRALDDDLRRSMKVVRESIEQARTHHARTGEWPPDPLLDEVAEMRRRVAAEDGYGLRKFRELMHEAEADRHDPAVAK